MTKTCCVCRKISVTGDSSRSFHKFPVNEDIKKQWMDALGISKVTVSCTVCSDHFTPDSYPDQTDGIGMVKRLLRTAIPFKKGVIPKKNMKSNVSQTDSSKRDQNKMCTRQSVSRTRQSNTNGHQTYTNPYYTYDDDQSCSNDSSANSTDEKMDMSNIGNKSKRKMPTTIIPSSNIRRMFRFRDGNETKYLCREEFVTEEAWNKFLRLMLLNRQRLEGRNQRLSVRKKILDTQYYNIRDEDNDDYKDEDAYEPEKFLEVILKE